VSLAVDLEPEARVRRSDADVPGPLLDDDTPQDTELVDEEVVAGTVPDGPWLRRELA